MSGTSLTFARVGDGGCVTAEQAIGKPDGVRVTTRADWRDAGGDGTATISHGDWAKHFVTEHVPDIHAARIVGIAIESDGAQGAASSQAFFPKAVPRTMAEYGTHAGFVLLTDLIRTLSVPALKDPSKNHRSDDISLIFATLLPEKTHAHARPKAPASLHAAAGSDRQSPRRDLVGAR